MGSKATTYRAPVQAPVPVAAAVPVQVATRPPTTTWAPVNVPFDESEFDDSFLPVPQMHTRVVCPYTDPWGINWYRKEMEASTSTRNMISAYKRFARTYYGCSLSDDLPRVRDDLPGMDGIRPFVPTHDRFSFTRFGIPAPVIASVNIVGDNLTYTSVVKAIDAALRLVNDDALSTKMYIAHGPDASGVEWFCRRSGHFHDIVIKLVQWPTKTPSFMLYVQLLNGQTWHIDAAWLENVCRAAKLTTVDGPRPSAADIARTWGDDAVWPEVEVVVRS